MMLTTSFRETLEHTLESIAEVPVVSRLLSGSVVLLLGYATLRGAHALLGARPETTARRRLLAGGTLAAGLLALWAGLAFVSRTRRALGVRALFTYGSALGNYLPASVRAA